MKLAVILGVLQMSLGILMKAFNNVYFGKMVDLFFEFLPQMILLLVLFGWMDALIIIKWNNTLDINDWTVSDMSLFDNNLTIAKSFNYSYSQYQRSVNPSIITSMINMFIHPGDRTPGVGLLFESQLDIAIVFVLIALITIPTMLLVKPLHFKFTHKEEHQDHSATAL